MAVYINSDNEQIILTPEISSAPRGTLEELADYVETHLRMIREDFMRMMNGTWRFIDVDDQIEAQQFDSATETWVKKFRVRGDG